VEFTDARIVEAYEYFMERYQGNLIFVVTSDHGLGLGDDKVVGDGPTIRKDKGSLHDFNLRIPFMILPSKQVARHANIDAPCSNIDITPTIADWAGAQLPNPVPGVSLLPAIRGDSTALTDRPLYARVSSFRRLSDGMFLDGKKYIRHFDHTTREVIERYVFEVASDRREVSSISNDFGEFEKILDAVADTRGKAWPAHFGDIPTETQRQLKALGYLSDD
jgi:arylsulfatase A-like enzyme